MSRTRPARRDPARWPRRIYDRLPAEVRLAMMLGWEVKVEMKRIVRHVDLTPKGVRP